MFGFVLRARFSVVSVLGSALLMAVAVGLAVVFVVVAVLLSGLGGLLMKVAMSGTDRVAMAMLMRLAVVFMLVAVRFALVLMIMPRSAVFVLVTVLVLLVAVLVLVAVARLGERRGLLGIERSRRHFLWALAHLLDLGRRRESRLRGL